MVKEEIINNLKKLADLLEEEKLALVNDNGDLIIEIVKEKEKIVDLLEKAESVNGDMEEIESLVETIRELQETNLMLTKQALNYQNSFIEAITKLSNLDSTYSADGKKNKQPINLVNQSV